MTTLGRLIRIANLRDVWLDEARNFTPWLAYENLDVLSEALGLGPDGLELEAVEKFVGPFKADILCKATGSGEWVLVENQLERTDHSHLGQIIVYAAGLQAATIVWVSRQVSSEHKAAMEWLNEISDGGPKFFALEIELWKIGDSAAAPRFNVVVRPNEATRDAATAKKGLEEGDLTDARQMLLDYWSAFEALLASRKSRVRPVKPQVQNWLVHGLGRTGVTLNGALNRRENLVRAEIYLTGPRARDYFTLLRANRAEIEADFGSALEWYDVAANDRRIHVTRHFADVADRASWPEQHEWLVTQFDALHRTFEARVRALDPNAGGMVAP